MNFGDLDPQQVLDALDATGFRGDGRVLQLNSYENRVFQVFLEDAGEGPPDPVSGAVAPLQAVVAKFYRPGRWSDAQILEEHAFALELAAAEVPVVPPLPLLPAAKAADALAPGNSRGQPLLLGTPPTLALQGAAAGAGAASGHRFMVASRCAGRESELDDPAALRQLGCFIGRLHAVGERRPFLHRHQLRPEVDAQAALDLLLAGDFVPGTEKPAWLDAAQQALQALADAFRRTPADQLRLHGDCHLGNVLWRPSALGSTPHIVDLDDAMQGPAVQDLWMLVSGDQATMAQQLDTLLQGYRQFRDFDDRERSLIEPLRTLRMLRHSAWLAARWGDPTFPQNFPFFGSAAYWNQQTTQLREQVEAMAEAAARAAGGRSIAPHWRDDEAGAVFDGDGFA